MKILKTTILLFALFSFHSCQQTQETIQPEPIVKIETIDPSQDENLLKIISDYQNSSSTNGRIKSFDFGDIDFSTALKAINELDTVVRYSLLMNESEELSFENVIFKEKNGETSAYILRYEPNLDWLTENNFEFIESSYTGILYVKNLNQSIMAKVAFTNGIGHLTDDSPSSSGRTNCDGNGSSGGGSSGGGGGSSGGGSSGGGGEGGSSGGGSSGGGSSGGSGGYGGGRSCGWGTSTATGGMWIDCPTLGLIFVARTACDGVEEVPSDLDGDGGDNGNGPIGILPKLEKTLLIARIEAETDPEAKRKLQLKYINDWGGVEGKGFKAFIEEELLTTRGLTVGDVTNINESVNTYYLNLRGEYIYAIFLPVAELSKPFIELALIDTGVGAFFQAVKAILSTSWGIQVVRIVANLTKTSEQVINSIKAEMQFGLNNSSLNINLNGRSLVGTANSAKKAYTFNGVTQAEAKAYFDRLTNGKSVTKVSNSGKTFNYVDLNNKNSIIFRNFSNTNQGEVTIQFTISSIREKTIELKFFP